MQREACLHDYMVNMPPPEFCDRHCKGIDCPPCPGFPKAPACVPMGVKALSVCM